MGGSNATSARWWMLVLISLGFVELTLNWFDVASGFPQIGAAMRLQIPQIALLVSLFFAGYGVFHIPTGFLASRFGLRRIALIGLVIESLGGIATGLAPSYPWLASFRVLAGIGGSLFVGCGFALVVAWFRTKELALAQGISGGVAFAVGASVGLFPWVGLIGDVGWRLAMVIGGLIGLLIFAANLIWLRTPAEEARFLAAGNLRWSSVGRVLSNATLLLMGIAVMGGFGLYFVASELMPGYVIGRFHMAPALAGLMGAVVVLAGIPASFLGGWWSDRGRTLKWFVLIPVLLLGVAGLLVPFSSAGVEWVLAAVIGGSLFAFPAFVALPGDLRRHIPPQDVATAEGLLLTLIAVGEFLVPYAFGLIAKAHGYPAAWIFAGAVSVVMLIAGLFARVPLRQERFAAVTAEAEGGGPHLGVVDEETSFEPGV